MKTKDLLSAIDEKAVVEAIEAAERACSGEIRVHIEPSSHGRDVRFMAERTFERLGMTKTALRKGVLIYLCAKQQTFAVIGDRGIHEKVGPEFWELVASHMHQHFSEGEFTAGVVDAIREIGQQLTHCFPHEGEADRNELSNQISIGPDGPQP